jgi:flagellar motor switch protein FliM
MPYAMLEPIRDLLYNAMQGDNAEPDHRWVKLLSRQVQDAEVELIAHLGRAHATLGDLMKMKPGDVIPLNVHDILPVMVDGVPVMNAHYGIYNGRYALRVNSFTNSAKESAPDELSAFKH